MMARMHARTARLAQRGDLVAHEDSVERREGVRLHGTEVMWPKEMGTILSESMGVPSEISLPTNKPDIRQNL